MPDAISPADRLKVLRQTLEENQTKAAELAKGSEHLKAQIADLEKTVKEVDQKKKDFEKAVASADQKKKELLAFVKREKQMLEATVPHAVIKAEKKIADDALKALEENVKTAATQAREKAAKLGEARTATATKQADFNRVAGRAAANDEIFKDLVALRAAADKQSAANNLSKMYFLVLVMEERLAQLDLISPAEQEQQLNAAGAALAAAAEAERAAKEASDAATEAEKQVRKDLETARAKSRQATLDAIADGPGNDSITTARITPPPGTRKSQQQQRSRHLLTDVIEHKQEAEHGDRPCRPQSHWRGPLFELRRDWPQRLRICVRFRPGLVRRDCRGSLRPGRHQPGYGAAAL